MATTTGITVDEFLNARWGNYEPEFAHGEIIERKMPNLLHGWIQGLIYTRLLAVGFPVIGVRMRVAADVIRLPDVAVFRNSLPSNPVPSDPPFVIVEVVSPDDPYPILLQKLRDYGDWGVPHIWIVVPGTKTFQEYRDGTLAQVSQFELPELNFRIDATELFAEPTSR